MFEKNVLLLSELYPDIYQDVKKIKNIKYLDDISEVVTKNDHANLLLQKDHRRIYLHSQYSPQNEAEKWLASQGELHGILVVVGGGYYYHIEELLNQNPDQKIVIIEPSYEIFVSALKRIDMEHLLRNPNLLFLLSDDTYYLSMTIANILINKGFQSFDLLILMSYKSLFSTFCAELGRGISETLTMLRCNMATEFVHSQKWMYNNFRNFLKANVESMPITPYLERFKDMPALIVSAGPSLEKQLPLLKENQEKFLIFAAGSAVNILEKNGIVPHFVVAVDGEEAQDRIFEQIESSEITLVYSHTFRYSALELFKGKKIWIKGNADHSTAFFENYIGIDTKVFEFGPSCANIAMDIARQLGCKQLIFVGQDLAYTNDQLYAKGAAHNLDITSDIGDRVVTTDMFGEEITTKTAFLVMKTYFENYIKHHDDTSFVNCTEGGLLINGMVHRPFADVISEFPNLSTNAFTRVETIFHEQRLTLKEQQFHKKTKYFLEYVKNEAEKIDHLSQERLSKVEQLLQDLEEGKISKVQLEFDEVNDLTEKLESYEIHKEVIYPIIAAYNLAVRENTYQVLEKQEELKEKYAVLLKGLQNQYQYYQTTLATLRSAIEHEPKVIG
ncbi:motility associated factor glycosyltransferase family protein [Halalkalibacterium ligniniphilum]|uniref:motility associated factor glycosyltransferase family protein n=1 Tax=Halalkalibacterium ligniniphilum TaxID=1134413 RepID=UPI00034A021E|nr:6-hydroxymethylpterin diphosphokinase MptE-like protein [Halalkalibacterium ligniniphilum]